MAYGDIRISEKGSQSIVLNLENSMRAPYAAAALNELDRAHMMRFFRWPRVMGRAPCRCLPKCMTATPAAWACEQAAIR
eukprot:3474950-Pleurochrysis_carterae.AAC.2